MSRRDAYRTQAEGNGRLIAAGGYIAPSGARVALATPVGRIIADVPAVPAEAPPPRVSLADEDSLGGIDRLAAEGCGRIGVLDFASARTPGGGYLRGGAAQEESLCRASTLYTALEALPDFYERNRAWPDTLYSDEMILVPEVEVFRDRHGTLRETPIAVAMIVAPAPNRRALAEAGADTDGARTRAALARRIPRILALGTGLDGLVLGAWGCGVFGNRPVDVARLFGDALARPGSCACPRVHFAIPGGRDDETLASFAGSLPLG